MDLENFKNSIVTNVYHISSDKDVALHNHSKLDKIFYRFKSEGLGEIDDGEIELTVVKTFIFSAIVIKALLSERDSCVTSFFNFSGRINYSGLINLHLSKQKIY